MATWCGFLGDGTYAVFVKNVLGRIAATMPVSASGGSPAVATGIHRADFAPPYFDPEMRRFVLELHPEVCPDLPTLLGERGLTGPARDDLERFSRLASNLAPGFSVGRCGVDEAGHYSVSVYRTGKGTARGVSSTDPFFSGAQLSGHLGSGVVLVETHLLRQVCVNGAVAAISVRDLPTYVRWSDDETEGDLESVVELGFSGRLLGEAMADLARAAQSPQPRLEDLQNRSLLHLDMETAVAVRRVLHQHPPTLFGLYNALTQVARDHPSIRAAIRLEREAGSLIPALLRKSKPENIGLASPSTT